MDIVKQTISHKSLNDGFPIEIYHDYDQQYLKNQFAEIFIKGHYKGALRGKDLVVLDIGANIGLSALYFKDVAKKIYAIEPNPDYFTFLVKNTEKYPNIECYNIGLGIDQGTSYLVGNANEERAESIWGRGDKKIEFQQTTIDEFFERQKIEHIDVLKIDCEGAEYPIFMSEGFGKVADKIDFIVGEAHYAPELKPEYIPEILKEYGFKTKFLKHKNIFTEFCLVNSQGTLASKKYKVFHNTIFEASKK